MAEVKIEDLRKMYEGFERGEAEALAVRDEARLVLKEAKKKGDQGVLEEVEDMLMELEFSIDADKCK